MLDWFLVLIWLDLIRVSFSFRYKFTLILNGKLTKIRINCNYNNMQYSLINSVWLDYIRVVSFWSGTFFYRISYG